MTYLSGFGRVSGKKLRVFDKDVDKKRIFFRVGVEIKQSVVLEVLLSVLVIIF